MREQNEFFSSATLRRLKESHERWIAQRPLPTLLAPGEMYETWKPVRDAPSAAGIEYLVRAQLGDGTIVPSGPNTMVSPAGPVGGGGRPLANALRQKGLRVWYDEFELRLGDSLRRKIDEGIARSVFGIVVLSPAFFAKKWTNCRTCAAARRGTESSRGLKSKLFRDDPLA